MQLISLARASLFATVLIGLAWASSVARADGSLSMRGVYYKERSTRVEQPMIDGTFDAGDGKVDGHFLVDSITSASSATGTAQAFTERRYEVGLGYTRPVGNLRIGGLGKYSTESDYFSRFGAVHAELDLFDKNTTIGLTEGRGYDTITNGIAVDNGAIGTPSVEKTLFYGLTSVTVTQVLFPWAIGSLTYDLSDLHGYQANLYRLVRGGTTATQERVPDLRLRNAVAVGGRFWIAPTRSVVVLSYRFYFDDWGVVAHTPEIRVIQEVVPGLELRARWRYHHESAADFFKDIYSAKELSDSQMGIGFVTDDAKLGAYTTQVFGGQLAVTGKLLGITGSWANARGDVILERVLQGNAFGDAWVGELGLSVPFAY